MNMRAAEAIVSNAPKARKIFPIREVWSQAESSLLAAMGRRGGAGWRLGRRQRHDRRRGPGFLQRAVEVVELIGGHDFGSPAGWLSAGCPAAVSRIVLALPTSPWPLPAVFGPVLRFALATDGGISGGNVAAGDVPYHPATSVAFLAVEDFSAALPDFRCACFFDWRGLAYLLSATGAPVAVSDFEVAGRAVITRLRLQWPRETHEEPCR